MRDLLLLVDRLHSIANTHKEDEPSFIAVALETFVQWEFTSARYYEITRDPAEKGEEVLVLRAFSQSDRSVTYPIGTRIPFKFSTLGIEGGFGDVAFGNLESSPEAAAEWIKKLHLEEDNWVDISIKDHDGELHYLLALSIRLPAEFPDNAGLFLRSIRSVFQGFYAAYRSRRFRELHKSTAAFFTKQRGPISAASIADLAAGVILNISGAQACAVFAYEWATRRLVKVAERFFEDADGIEMEHREVFGVGQHLTGLAWEKPELRHIPDFLRYIMGLTRFSRHVS